MDDQTSRDTVQKIKILLADDHAVMRQALSTLLEAQDDLTVIGQAADGLEAVRLAAELRPDVILMDVSMPGMDGVSATAEIHKNQPVIRIIGLSMHDESNTRERMTAAGAEEYIPKASSAEKLIRAIRGKTEGT